MRPNINDGLRRTTYMGRHYFNQTNSRTGAGRPREEWVAMEVPAIIPEEDFQAMQALERRLLQPERLTELLSAFLDHSEASNEKRRQELILLRTEKTNTEGTINRLYELVEQGLATPTEASFAERLTRQRQRLDLLTADIALLERQLAKEQRRITPDVIDRFGTLLRTNLRTGDPPCAKAMCGYWWMMCK